MDLIIDQKYKVSMRDCDLAGAMRPSAMLGLFQDGSGLVLERLGMAVRPLAERGLLWVVARMNCAVHRAPLCEEEIRWLVWPEKPKLGMLPWQYRLEAAGGELLVSATAVWVMVDAESRSMLSERIPHLSFEAPEPPAACMPHAKGLGKMPELTRRTGRTVLYSETDMNGHLTNTRYLDWAMDLPPAAYPRTHRVSAFSVDFRAECPLESEISIQWDLRDNTLWCRAGNHFDIRMDFA